MFRILLAVSCCALINDFTVAGEPAVRETPPSASHPLFPAVRGLLDKLPGASGAVSRLTTDDNPGLLVPLLNKSEGTDEVTPTLVQVRLSQEFLAGFLERDIHRQSEVRETILGTSVGGTATTLGTTTLVLHPSDDRAVVEVILKGSVQARTIGHNGPVQLHCSSTTPFESRKIIHLRPDGIEAMPARTVAKTTSTTNQIRSTLPGLRGRIAQRIAHGRAQDLRGAADAIASRNTERRLNREFDQSVEKSLTNARGAVQDKLVSLPIGKLSDDWRYRSRPGYVEMILPNPENTADSGPIASGFETDAAVAVRIHRSAVRTALANAELQQSLRPLLASLANRDRSDSARVAEVRTKTIPAHAVSETRSPEFRVAWSADEEWLEFSFSPNELNSAGAVAPTVAVSDR